MNNGYNNFNGYPTGGYYGGAVYKEAPKINMTQGLNPEQLKSLRKTGGFNLEISEEELWRSFCTHRYDNRFATSMDEEGYMTCSLCGTKFRPFEGNVNDARELVNKTVDLLETTKMQSLTLSPKIIQEYFQIEPVLKRLPELFAQSQNDYKRALGMDNSGYYYGQENNAFMMYQNFINPMAGNGFYDPAVMQQQPVYGSQVSMMQQAYPQPMMQQGYNQPMMQQAYPQPMMQQGYQPYQQPMMNNGAMDQNPFNVNGAPVTNTAPQNNNNGTDTVTVKKTMTD